MTLIESHGVKAALVEAILAARDRARELGDEFGRPAPSGASATWLPHLRRRKVTVPIAEV